MNSNLRFKEKPPFWLSVSAHVSGRVSLQAKDDITARQTSQTHSIESESVQQVFCWLFVLGSRGCFVSAPPRPPPPPPPPPDWNPSQAMHTACATLQALHLACRSSGLRFVTQSRQGRVVVNTSCLPPGFISTSLPCKSSKHPPIINSGMCRQQGIWFVLVGAIFLIFFRGSEMTRLVAVDWA